MMESGDGKEERKPPKWVRRVLWGLFTLPFLIFMLGSTLEFFDSEKTLSDYGSLGDSMAIIAVGAALIAIFLQTKELALQRAELQETREELARHADVSTRMLEVQNQTRLQEAFELICTEEDLLPAKLQDVSRRMMRLLDFWWKRWDSFGREIEKLKEPSYTPDLILHSDWFGRVRELWRVDRRSESPWLDMAEDIRKSKCWEDAILAIIGPNAAWRSAGVVDGQPWIVNEAIRVSRLSWLEKVPTQDSDGPVSNGEIFSVFYEKSIRAAVEAEMAHIDDPEVCFEHAIEGLSGFLGSSAAEGSPAKTQLQDLFQNYSGTQ